MRVLHEDARGAHERLYHRRGRVRVPLQKLGNYYWSVSAVEGEQRGASAARLGGEGGAEFTA